MQITKYLNTTTTTKQASKKINSNRNWPNHKITFPRRHTHSTPFIYWCSRMQLAQICGALQFDRNICFVWCMGLLAETNNFCCCFLSLHLRLNFISERYQLPFSFVHVGWVGFFPLYFGCSVRFGCSARIRCFVANVYGGCANIWRISRARACNAMYWRANAYSTHFYPVYHVCGLSIYTNTLHCHCHSFFLFLLRSRYAGKWVW